MPKLVESDPSEDEDWPRVVADTASGRRVSDSSTAERIHHCSMLCLPNVTCWEHCTERVCGSAQHKCGDWLVMSATDIGKAECAHISYFLSLLRSLHTSTEKRYDFCPIGRIMHNNPQLFFSFVIRMRAHNTVCVIQTCCKSEGLFKEKLTHRLLLTI